MLHFLAVRYILQKKVFTKHLFHQQFLFMVDGFYYSMDLLQLPLSLAGEIIILKILKFELLESFNSAYFNLMSKHFLCR